MCGGIPLLVELVGPKFKKYLSRASEFKSLKEFLKDFVAAGRDIERVVDEVYKSLDELSKEAFLDIVCFFDKDEVREVSVAVGKVQLDVLLDAALVKLSFDADHETLWSILLGTEEERPQFLLTGRKVRVHDIIKERGRWLSKQDRIVEVESLKDALQDTQKLQKIKGIAISNSKDSDVLEIEAERLDIMHSSLRVLKIANSVKVNGICQRSFESLKYLSVDGNLPMHPKQLKRLAVLTGPEGANSENVDKLPASLQMLSLKDSANIPTLLQSFDTLSSLEYLNLEGCHALVKVPTSFGQLQSLIGLDLSRCSNLATLPENIKNLSALQFLNLYSCTELASLPPTFGQLKSLQCLIMGECSELTCLPDNFHNLSTLQMLLLKKCEKLVELPKSFGALSALKFLDLSSCSNLKFLPESFGQLKSLKFLSISSCNNLKTLTGGFRSLTSLMILDASSCKSLDEEAVDILVETRSLLFLNIDESPSLIQRWNQIGHCYPLIVGADGDVDDDSFSHTVEHTLFHGGSRFVGVNGDGGQLVDWSWSCFSGEEEEEEVEVEVSMLLTMCDLSLDCNNSALQIVRKEIERRMEESRNGGQKFQLVYAEAGDSVDSQSEEHIHQTLMKLLPNCTCTCACMPVDNRTNRLFAYALYALLQSESRYVIQSLHTCIFGLRVRMQRDKKWAEFQSECFPNDYEEALIDQGGGFKKLFSTLDICSDMLI
ncbi:disease resistance protein RPV1-like [Cryptomeria japonica]|uniref:disease resistance protein RPV1-like n=1 Tax=Cryptomeria japonica TaxID=3369 RepID=UPI0027DA2BCD|nr:disease resistance protein RPV1-like [Cryptomeria japonica]